MSFCVSKKYGKLIFRDLGGHETRNSSTFWCIERADEIYNWEDFEEIKLYTGDYDEDKHDYTYSKRDSYNNLIPDFNFHAWPQVGIDDYEYTIKQIDNIGLGPYEINKVGWIGNLVTNVRRNDLIEIGNNNKDLFDFFSMSWMDSGNTRLNATKYLSIIDLVKTYSVLIDIEGNGYSGRLKYLLWSHRPLILIDRPHKEFFFEHLKEWEHYIPVKRDMSDLVEKTKWCMDNYEKALQIAENAYQFCTRHLTRIACYEQWNRVIGGIIQKRLAAERYETSVESVSLPPSAPQPQPRRSTRNQIRRMFLL
jgi:hypothetical protein